jgi:mannitol-specific phosphotransferase system IIBC component
MFTQPTDSSKKSSSNNLNCQMAQYSLVAAVAGLGMLALAQPAAGEVVVTKKTIPIPLTSVGVPEPVKISMANNGINDFSFEPLRLQRQFDP